MPEQHHSKVLSSAPGPAGYTAAIYAARANLQPILVRGLQPGGQLTITTDVENYPGFADIIQGPWLMEQMQAPGRACRHASSSRDIIVSLDLSRRPFVAIGDSGDIYIADSDHHLRPAPRRAGSACRARTTYRGFGVSACATCDGFFFRGKEVVVVGGGNTAVEEALYLTNHARQVTLIHRRDTLRAEKILQDRLFRNPKIAVVWDSVVEEILGEPSRRRVTGVRLRNVKTGARQRQRLRRRLRRHRPHAGDRPVQGPAPARPRGLYPDRPDSTATDDSRGVRRRRRQGQDLPPGGHGRRDGLHGGARGGEVSRRAGSDADAAGGRSAARAYGRRTADRRATWRWIGTSCGFFTRSPRRAASRMPARR